MLKNVEGLPCEAAAVAMPPKIHERRPGAFAPGQAGTIQIGGLLREAAPELARSLRDRLCDRLGLMASAGGDSRPPAPFLLIGLAPDHPLLRQLSEDLPFAAGQALVEDGFVLDVTPERALLAASTPRGAYYGAMTLLEQAAEANGPLPAGRIADWPAMRRRGLHLLVKSRADLLGLETIITEQMPRLRLNELILEINYFFQFQSHPEVAEGDALTRDDCRHLKELADQCGVRLIPMINCLGHQSWAEHTAQLLTSHPEFDETPGPQPDPKFYCRSWCPSHPDVNGVVCDLIDELLDAFDADAFHVGMDEVFVLGECPRCQGQSPAALFAQAVNDLHAHLVGRRQVEMLIWGDRLLDAKTTGYGLWEGSGNGTAPAISLIPKDIVLCDWHYETQYGGEPATYPSVRYFQEQGFQVWPSGWNSAENVRALAGCALQSLHDRSVGYLATTWVGVAPVAGGLAGDQEQLRKKNVSGIVDAIRVGARIAWTGE